MASHFIYRDQVQFAETDQAGIVHFSYFFRYFERCEHAFFRSLGLSIAERYAASTVEPQIGWPRVHASCDFRSPLRFEDEIDVHLYVEEKRSKSLHYLFRIYKADGNFCAEGRFGVVCIAKDPNSGQMRATDIPQRITQAIDVYPQELLNRSKDFKS